MYVTSSGIQWDEIALMLVLAIWGVIAIAPAVIALKKKSSFKKQAIFMTLVHVILLLSVFMNNFIRLTICFAFWIAALVYVFKKNESEGEDDYE